MKTIWIDVETTGLDFEKCQIIELAALYENGKESDLFHKYCKPESRPDNFAEIEELTGISWSFLEDCGVSERQLYIDFVEFLSKKIDRYDRTDKALFAAFNADFDNQFLRELFKRNGDNYFGSWFHSARLDVFSTVAMAYRFEVLDVQPNNKNETIAKALDIQLTAHSAIEDIKASRQIQIILENKILARSHDGN